jgi:hypothetical protein
MMASCSRHKRSSLAPNLVSNWCQRPPFGPVLPVLPSHNHFIVNDLPFLGFHGMEEVIGSIPYPETQALMKVHGIGLSLSELFVECFRIICRKVRACKS